MVSMTVFPDWQHNLWLERKKMALQGQLKDSERELEGWFSSQRQVSVK